MKWRPLFALLVALGPLSSFAKSKDIGISREHEEEFLASLKERARISDEEWMKIASEVTEQRYIVQQGDTLWEICAKFLDSPYYWPKLWQINAEGLSNPHQLRVGMELHFIVGSGTTLPKLEASNSEKESKPEFFDQSIDLLPEIKQKKGEFDDLGFKTGLVRAKKVHERFRPQGIIVREDVPNLGEVVGSMMGRTYFDHADTIYIDLESNDSLKEGQLYSAYKYEGKVTDPDSALGFAIGHWVRILAEVRILEVKDGKARAEVIRVFDEFVRGSFITNHYDNLIDIKPQYVAMDLKADIVQLADHAKNFDGQGGIVFINRGSNDKIKPGTMFNVITTKDGLTNSSRHVRPEVKGTLMVIATEPYSSACVIMSSAQEMFVGDFAVSARGP